MPRRSSHAVITLCRPPELQRCIQFHCKRMQSPRPVQNRDVPSGCLATDTDSAEPFPVAKAGNHIPHLQTLFSTIHTFHFFQIMMPHFGSKGVNHVSLGTLDIRTAAKPKFQLSEKTVSLVRIWLSNPFSQYPRYCIMKDPDVVHVFISVQIRTFEAQRISSLRPSEKIVSFGRRCNSHPSL